MKTLKKLILYTWNTIVIIIFLCGAGWLTKAACDSFKSTLRKERLYSQEGVVTTANIEKVYYKTYSKNSHHYYYVDYSYLANGKRYDIKQYDINKRIKNSSIIDEKWQILLKKKRALYVQYLSSLPATHRIIFPFSSPLARWIEPLTMGLIPIIAFYFIITIFMHRDSYRYLTLLLITSPFVYGVGSLAAIDIAVSQFYAAYITVSSSPHLWWIMFITPIIVSTGAMILLTFPILFIYLGVRLYRHGVITEGEIVAYTASLKIIMFFHCFSYQYTDTSGKIWNKVHITPLLLRRHWKVGDKVKVCYNSSNPNLRLLSA